MNKIEVGCAIIIKEGKILIAQRKPGAHLGGFWEFPGGKCRDGEGMERCLVREVEEELGVTVRLRALLRRTEYAYPDRTVLLHFWLCDWRAGKPERLDCRDFRWVAPEELRCFRFPLGDDAILNELIRKKGQWGQTPGLTPSALGEKK